ncbi:MAG: transporter substrate-binding domain-containing protein [Actinomycetota bacterium]|jgi:polar amino acid transport system substrate-binding protein|nr:transporter substrate-binding domain-containing protein [Actinomycetota bacterium]
MRCRGVVLASVLLVSGAGLGVGGFAAPSGASPDAQGPGNPAPLRSCSYSSIQPYLYSRGHLTIATDKPAYPPWFEHNRPTDGKGYESGVAYAVAKKLGFKKSQVNWVVETFNASYAPGPKHFDFDINEISVTKTRAKAVTFSKGYYTDDEALVALKGTPIVKHHTPAALKRYVFGEEIGTTALQYINSRIQPDHVPETFTTLNDVKSALQDHRIAAFVTDTPTSQYIATTEIPHSVVVGQFPASGQHYGLLFQKGDKLVKCVNKAIVELKRAGVLRKLAKKYLRVYTSIPVIKP